MSNVKSEHSGIQGIDHVVITVRFLDQARHAYERLGFQSADGGRHLGWGTANHLCVLANGYLELIGVVDPTDRVDGLARFLERREGISGIALTTQNARASYDFLIQAGLDARAPEYFERRLPRTNELVAFNLLYFPEETTVRPRMFLCEHLTPSAVYKAGWLRHPNGAQEILAVVASAPVPAQLSEIYGRLVGRAATVEAGHDICRIRMRNNELILAAREEIRRDCMDVDVGSDALAYFGTVLRVDDLDRTEAYLSKAGLDFDAKSNSLIVGPKDACGMFLQFVERN
jgi:catechol 2,3-dioxygenase-like lactoylglutathione lyase family enzyme